MAASVASAFASAPAQAAVVDVSGADSVAIKTYSVKKASPSPTPAPAPVAKLPAKRRPKVAASLPTSLPAFKGRKIHVNFDNGATPSSNEPTIVIRDRNEPPSTNQVQSIRAHDVKEAPYLEVVEDDETRASAAGHELRPALPDSDSFVNVPGRASVSREYKTPVAVTPKAPTASTANGLIIAPSISQVQSQATAIVEAAKLSAPTSEVIETPTQVAPDVKSEATSVMTTVKPTPALPSYWPYSSADNSSAVTASAMTEAALPNVSATPDDQIKDTLAKTETESSLDSEKAAEETAYTKTSTPVLKTTFMIPHDEIAKRRIFVRTGFLNAQYSQLEGDLKNGASVFGVSASQVFSKTEVRLGIDVAHGLDQSINLRNTRMAMFRAEGLLNFAAAGPTRFFGGGVIGVADIDVTSYHAVANSADVAVRENAKGTALLAAPELGSRVLISRDISFDLTAQYLLLAGGDEISKLGGLLLEAAVGFTF